MRISRRTLLATSGLYPIGARAQTYGNPSGVAAGPYPATGNSPGAGPTAPLTHFVGPGDIVSGAAAFYGLRAYNAAYATGSNKAINVRRASDNTTMDILILANGNLDVATATTFLAATTGYITEWYDQSGNGNHMVQATAGTQPQLLLTGANGLPTVAANGSQNLATIGSPASGATVYTIVAVAERTGAFTTFGGILASGGGSFFYNATNAVVLYEGTLAVTGVASDSVLHAMQFIANDPSSFINVDGGSTPTGSAGGNVFGSPASLFFGNNPATANISEAGIYAAAFNSTQVANMRANMKAFWGTP
jgi:hypothetical protein